MKIIYVVITAIFFVHASFATVRLPAVISSNMILQQQSRTRLWGWSDPGEKITITTSWNGRSDSATGTRDGRWLLELPTPAAGGPFTITIKGYNTIELRNVMIGEVWICSGQSNMEMSGSWGLADIKNELPVCKTNDIHFFQIPRTTASWPQDDCKAEWTTCDSTTLKTFSAAAYFFAKKLSATLHVPVGLIEAAWGGTPAEVWTPAGLVTGDSVLLHDAGKQTPYNGWPYTPGYCYNGMITPVTNYEIAGAIWYQGEGNTAAPLSYSKLFTAMIGAWRKAWNKELPFYYVQIAPFTYGTKDQASLLREQQARTLHLPNTGMVVISDIAGDTTDIHPKNKHDVGLRLANWALAETYHQSGIAYKSPAYKDMQVAGDKVIINVTDAPGGLVIKELPLSGQARSGSAPVTKWPKDVAAETMMVAGADKVFYPAQVRISGSSLTVWSPKVKVPVAVRYQFSNAGVGNVFSQEGLPLAPFRTDDWTVWP